MSATENKKYRSIRISLFPGNEFALNKEKPLQGHAYRKDKRIPKKT
jgi:hypothetical protein